MLPPFSLHQPETVQQAVALLREHGDDARLYAGGTELLLVMKAGLLHCGHLVDLKTIRGFDTIAIQPGAPPVLRIGAGATHRQIERSAHVQVHLPTLVDLETQIANVRVRNAGTIGGNLCFAEPHADPGTLLLVHEARVGVAGSNGDREVPMEELFVDMFEVSLEPDEILTRVDVPLDSDHAGSAYVKFGTLERPSVGVATWVRLTPDGQGVEDARLGVGSVGPTPFRAREAEERLRGTSVADLPRVAREAGAAAARDGAAVSDLYGSSDYKRHLVSVLVGRAVGQAAERAAGRRR